MKQVKVGLFNLPGIKFEKDSLSEELHQEMLEWSKEHKCGTQMNEWLWSFKNEKQRDWFILRWYEFWPKEEDPGL
jgi:hypothetical protein